MDVDALIVVLEENNIPEKVTEYMIGEFASTRPFLPVFDPSELWDVVEMPVIEKIGEVMGVGYNHHDFTWTLFKALEFAGNSSMRSISNTRKGSHANVLYDPKGYISRTFITRDFIDYVVSSGELTAFAITQLDACLKRNHIDYPLDIADIPDPEEDELMAVVFAGLLRMAKNKPNVFQREVAAVMREKGIDVAKYTRTTMFDAIKDAKIIPG